MFKLGVTLTALSLCLIAGCNFFPCDMGLPFLSSQAPQSVGDATAEDLNDPNSPAKNSPAAKGEPVRLRVANPTGRDADCTVTMEMVGREVHYTFRRVIAAANALIIGPDKADTIRVDAVFIGTPDIIMQTQILRLGEDYQPGDTVDVTLKMPEDDSQQDVKDDQNDDVGPPPPPGVDVLGLVSDVYAVVGDDVTFSVTTSDAPDGAVIAVFADPLDPNYPVVEILDSASASPTTTIVWNTDEVIAAEYSIRAELWGDGELLANDSPAGHVILELLGACCGPDGGCELVVERNCVLGEWQGGDTSCDDCPYCIVLCPADAKLESEACGDNDNYGCVDPCMPVFEPIACGETICGTSWLYGLNPDDPNKFTTRLAADVLRAEGSFDPNNPFIDLDWYEFTIGHDAEVTINISSEFVFVAGLIDQSELGVAGCYNLNYYLTEPMWGSPCYPETYTRCLPQGTYYFVIFPYYYEAEPFDCDSNGDYTIALDCTPCDYYAGACCFGDYCEMMNAHDCYLYDGEYQGDGVTCLPNNPCVEATGACCYSDGTCYVTYEVDCYEGYGFYWGDYTACDPNPCPQPTGACCYWDGYCEEITSFECDYSGGDSWIPYASCDPNPCPQPAVGACCDWKGDCEILTQYDCGYIEGEYQGDGSSCDPNPCPQPTGACCFYDVCYEMTEEDCIGEEGDYLGDFTGCVPNPCQIPSGACCLADGVCEILDEMSCATYQGVFMGEGVLCDPNPCDPPITGACCIDGVCFVKTEDECASYGGFYWGDDFPCSAGLCEIGVGDNCETPYVIDLSSQLPFEVYGLSTCGRGNYHSETCMSSFDEGEEIVFRLVAVSPISITVMLNPDGTPYTAMSLSPYCPPDEVCNTVIDSDGVASPYVIMCEPLIEGEYFLMIDLAELGGGCIEDFDLYIGECQHPVP